MKLEVSHAEGMKVSCKSRSRGETVARTVTSVTVTSGTATIGLDALSLTVVVVVDVRSQLIVHKSEIIYDSSYIYILYSKILQEV